LMKHVLDLLLVLFDGGEPVVEAGALHLLLMIAHGLVMVATSREGTYVFPDGHSRLLHSATADSSQSCHPAIAHLSPNARSSQRAKERAAPNQHAQAGVCGKIPIQHARAGACEKYPAGPSLHSW
jgi:hypothetical protein